MDECESMTEECPFEQDVIPQQEVLNQASGENWTLFRGDCIETLQGLPDESIGYSVFSPPFSQLYTFTNSDRDLSNSSSDEEFWTHYGFLAVQLYRVLQQGRLVSVHMMNMPSTKQWQGYIGIRDFRGDCIRAMASAGFIYHSEVAIWKDPVTAMQRTKALGLLHKQLVKDSTMSRQGIADYIVNFAKPRKDGLTVDPNIDGDIASNLMRMFADIWEEVMPQSLITFRKPGTNKAPVHGKLDHFAGDPETFRHDGDMSIDIWQRYASPVWTDIRQSNTLQYQMARDNSDERHISPLQLDVIERCIQLWTNPGDVVLSPFAGIGSEGFQSILMERKFIGVEIKESYFRWACDYLRKAESIQRQKSRMLF